LLPLCCFFVMRFFALFLTALGLSACTVGPDFKLPDLGLSARWKTQADVSDLPLPDEWWRQFRCAELNDLVQTALKENQDLAAALARVEAARAMTGSERAGFLPQLGLQNSATYERLSGSSFGANLPPGVPLPALERDRYQGFLTLNYELDLWGKIRRGVESAKAKEAAAVDQAAAQRLIIAAEVARNYFLAASLDEQIRLVEATRRLRDQSLDLQNSRLKAGLSNELDLNRAKAERGLTQNDLLQLQRQRGTLENTLAVLCGLPANHFRLRKSLRLPALPRVTKPLPSELLQRRPDLREAEQKLRSANAEIGVAVAEYFPSFKLIGTGGLENIGAEDFLDWQNRTANIGPQLTVPLFQGGRLRAKHKQAQARYNETLAEYKKAILTALAEVENAALEIRTYSQQERAVQSARSANTEAASLARTRYEKGLTNYFEVVDSERSVLSTQLLEAQIQGQRLAASVQLIRALGGGWNR
jgi:outer membrane protein, multidrug efflux system